MKRIIHNFITRIKILCRNVKAEAGAYVGFSCKIVNVRGTINLGRNSTVHPGTHLYVSGDAILKIGENSEIGRGSTISSVHYVQIGKNVLTGPRVYIADHNHEYRDISCPICSQGVHHEATDRVCIGDGSWLGTNVVIAGNVCIGRNCVIGANSVVTCDIPDYCVAVGAPARVVKRYNVETLTWEKVTDR